MPIGWLENWFLQNAEQDKLYREMLRGHYRTKIASMKKIVRGIHRLTTPLHIQIGSTLFCRLNATAARLKNALNFKRLHKLGTWKLWEVVNWLSPWMFLRSSFQCSPIQLNNAFYRIHFFSRAMTLMNYLMRKLPCSEIKDKMNAALKGASTSFSGHITIYSELNSCEVKYVLNKFNFPGACNETNIISKMHDFCFYIYIYISNQRPLFLSIFTFSHCTKKLASGFFVFTGKG